MDDSTGTEILDYELDEQVESEVNVMKIEGLSVDSNFADLPLKPEIMKAVRDLRFEQPSEIQNKCIEHAALGVDIIGQAPSGMGKTVAFILTTLQQLTPENKVQVLVMCPTRELAYQIGKQYKIFSKHMADVKVATFFGGFPVEKDESVLKHDRPQIVVGTPGRILSLIKFKKLNPESIRHFVLDECDKMLQSMLKHIQEIFFKLPHRKTVMMFSATLNQQTMNLCKRFMKDPVKILVDEKGNLEMRGLLQHYVALKESEKNVKLFQVLDSVEYDQVVIFVKSTIRCRKLENLLVKRNYSAVGIFRDMMQKERLARYQQFESSAKKILVATNIFGRGMNVENINLVINYDMPVDSDAYVHSVSRAKRFGAMGTAVTFVCGEYEKLLFQELQHNFNNNIIEWVKPESSLQI